MPWFPDFTNAVELARLQARADGLVDPVTQYLKAITSGDLRLLETVWPGELVIYDPRAGEVRGHRQLRDFVHGSLSWLAGHKARTEVVASVAIGGRAVVELLAHLDDVGEDVAWPVAVVAESPDDLSVVFRTYCSQLPVDGRRHVRSPILPAQPVQLDDEITRYLHALAAGNAEAVVATFEPDGDYREAIGPHATHRGRAELLSYFTACFSGGGATFEPCTATDDGVRCAVEYNCVRWGGRDLEPQAGIAVFERGADGLLAAVRNYDDVAPADAGP
jgi:hypothetical protein